jgi:hypothetical protein
MKKAYSYQRFSSIKQKEGDSTKRQTDAAVKLYQPVARYVSSVDKTFTREGRIVGNGDLRLFTLGKNPPK